MRRRDFVIGLGLAAAARSGLARPSAGWAPQEGAGPLIGFIHGSAPVAQYNSYIAAFLDGLKEEGFEHRKDVLVEYRWAEGKYERVPALVAELLALKPKLIAAYGPPNLLRAAVDSIPRDMPLVFGTGGDPLASGIVPSLARPAGNVTGIANRTNALDIKRLELLRDLAPEAHIIGMILNPKNSDAEEVRRAAQEGARSLGRALIVLGASTPEQLDEAFASATQQRAGAVLMGSDTFLNAQSDRIIALAAKAPASGHV